MNDRQIRRLAVGGVMAALVFVMTYVPKVPVPATGGYVHLGDGMVFLAGMLLGPAGVAAAALGSALSDLAGGYLTYLLPTAVIKGVMALLVWKLAQPRVSLRTLLVMVLAEAVMVAGYFGFEAALYGVAAAMGAVGGNVMQALAGVIIGMMCAAAAKRLQPLVK